MSNIEKFLRGERGLGELTEAERCAICEAMLGEFVGLGSMWFYSTARSPIYDYLRDGTAALRLQVAFGLSVSQMDEYVHGGPWYQPWNCSIGEYDGGTTGRTPAEAIVNRVCEEARAQIGRAHV